MAEEPVALDRRFIVWSEPEGPADLHELGELLAARESLTWQDLLAKHRVVILAEAGSGKSTEVGEQARQLQRAGRQVFLATVRAVGERGVESALGIASARRWRAWRQSDEPAWLFVDSVDEAKCEIAVIDVSAQVGATQRAVAVTQS